MRGIKCSWRRLAFGDGDEMMGGGVWNGCYRWQIDVKGKERMEMGNGEWSSVHQLHQESGETVVDWWREKGD